MQYIIPHMYHDVFCISITTNKIINTWEGGYFKNIIASFNALYLIIFYVPHTIAICLLSFLEYGYQLLLV